MRNCATRDCGDERGFVKEEIAMSFTVTDQPVPLVVSDAGVIHIADTRITLDTIVAAFHEGATPETIVQQYPSLLLADVYAVISYYLKHRAEVDSYLSQREKTAAQIRRENENRFDPQGIRDRLIARRRKQG